MKCGTTSLFHALAEHPEIARPRTKEPDFFTEHWDEGWTWYENLWQQPVSEALWALEASTSYTKRPRLPNAAERMARTKAEYRFVYLMRDPIARIESHRRHGFLRAAEGDGPPAVSEQMIAVSRYAMQLDAYREHFGRERILLLAFEELRERPSVVLRRVCDFLGIDASFPFPARPTQFNKSARDGRAYRLLQGLPIVSQVARRLPLAWRRSVRNRLSQAPPELPPLDLAERRAIAEALAEDLERLRSEYAFDTSVWGA